MDANEGIAIFGVLIGLFLTGLVAILGGFLHARRERILTHTERMRALELGRKWPDDEAVVQPSGSKEVKEEGEKEGSLARKCFSTALWIAFWGFIAAASGGVSAVVASVIAASVGAIGVTAIICGTILAARAPAATATGLLSKPTVEADAFDVVSCHG